MEPHGFTAVVPIHYPHCFASPVGLQSPNDSLRESKRWGQAQTKAQGQAQNKAVGVNFSRSSPPLPFQDRQTGISAEKLNLSF